MPGDLRGGGLGCEEGGSRAERKRGPDKLANTHRRISFRDGGPENPGVNAKTSISRVSQPSYHNVPVLFWCRRKVKSSDRRCRDPRDGLHAVDVVAIEARRLGAIEIDYRYNFLV